MASARWPWAVGLGIVSVVAANWEDIPGLVRLSVHLALIAGLLGLVFAREERLAAQSPWAVEALVFIIAALGLTFFGHLGQVYQTSSPLWQPLALWLVLFAPLLLLTGRSWPAALAVVGGAAWCAWEYAGHMNPYDTRLDTPWHIWLGIVTALPVLFAPFGAALRAHSQRPDFWRRMEQIALAYAVAGASLACAAASAGELGRGDIGGTATRLLASGIVGVIAGAGVAALRRGTSGAMAGAIIAGAGVTAAMAVVVDDLDVPAALQFMVLWTGIAAAALAAHWRGVFQLAVGVIALRLIILSFELAADLLTSGFGLILSGLLILGVAWVAVRVSTRFAPRSEPDA